MPPSSAARKASRAQRSVTEFGSPDHVAMKASGLYQTSTVQDRVRQWQVHGAATAPPPDAVSVLSAPRSDRSVSPEANRCKHEDQQARTRSQRHKTEGLDSDEVRKPPQMRSASTPRKRVVSDEHWKAKRSPKQALHVDLTEDQDLGSAVPASIAPKAHTERSIKQARAEREERRRRRAEARSRKVQDANHDASDRKRVHAFSNSCPSSVAGEPVSTQDVRIESGEAKHSEISPTANGRSPSDFDGSLMPEEDDSRTRRRSRYAETLGRPPPAYQDAQLRSKKGTFLNKTKEVLGIADPVPEISNRLPSIEAWLEEQPDPFVESTVPKVRFEDEVLKQPKTRSVKRKPSQKSPALPDPNQIWDRIGTHTRAEQPASLDHDRAVTEPLEAVHQPDTSSPVSLKRRGAKTSRLKRHTLQHIPQQAEDTRQENKHASMNGPAPAVKTTEQRACPQTGPTRLSTIASAETLRHDPQTYEQNVGAGQEGLKPELTTHEDMMNVLSQPSSRKSTRRTRSIKITNHQSETDPVTHILEALAEDEANYNRELRTLVDGVIPVLLQCVLSKSDAAAAADLFSTSANTKNDLSFSRPIIDMGIALERLKSLHNRIPLRNVDSLLAWCQTAHKAYSDYLKAWRLGFQDVVVNLAPLEGSDGENNEVMARDASGDVVNSDGQKVDVAYLMKRPLVNIRKLGRALNSLQDELPNHPVAQKLAEDYQDLTAAAKTKHQQEKGRLEDEAATDIDATKCRDVQSMGPLPGAKINGNKRVRARDCFNMTLFHSSGQRMDCKIELILRDNQHDSPDGGDLLICQMEETGKWLLFAPVDLSLVSARKGESGCDLVVMIRGRAGIGQEWRELLALKADEPESVSEWMIMLGSNPLPPRLSRVPSFLDFKNHEPTPVATKVVDPTKSALARVPSIETIDVPIGEPSILGVVLVKEHEPELVERSSIVEKPSAKLSMGGGLQKKHIPAHWQTQNPGGARRSLTSSIHSSDKSTLSIYSGSSASTYTPSSLAPMNHSHPLPQQIQKSVPQPPLQPQAHYQQPRYGPQVTPRSPDLSSPPDHSSTTPRSSKVGSPAKNMPLSTPTKEREIRINEISEAQDDKPETIPGNPIPHHAPSSTPTEDPPSFPKVRGNSVSSVPLTDTIRETWSTISGFGRKVVSQPSTPVVKDKLEAETSLKESMSFHPKNRRNSMQSPSIEVVDDSPSPLPQHKVSPVTSPKPRSAPTLRPSEAQKKMDRQSGRVQHSPLRKEYTLPSDSASEDSNSELSFSSDDDSQTSEEYPSEQYGYHKPMASTPNKHFSLPPITQIGSAPTAGTRTLAPSDSASQGPYRKVPSSADRPDVVKKRATAMICSWSDSGVWEPLVNNYCSIVISPGLMEAFLMTETPPGPSDKNQHPLAAFELTPLVPLRRPTGLDISIRSPPTPNSQIKTSNNVMFRSHTAAECEALYQMINWSRCNNRTYIELERSRPRPQPTVTFSNQQAPRPRSWFSFGGGVKRQNSYRVGNIPPSSMGESQATANTVSSAMSALRRLTKSSGFNVNRSSVIRRPGLTTNASLYSSSNGEGIGSGTSTPQPSQIGMIPGKDGPNVPPTSAAAVNGGGMVHNMRIRLQIRQEGGWVTMGFSRLTILPAVKRSNGSPEASRPGSSGSNAAKPDEQSRRASTTGPMEPQQRQYRLPSSDYTPHRVHGGGREKRIVVTADKDPSHVLLDATLGESCFEKISHLGIAVQVWKADDEVRSRGGVILGQNTKYLFQFFHAKECAWVFELVGRYRYSAAITH